MEINVMFTNCHTQNYMAWVKGSFKRVNVKGRTRLEAIQKLLDKIGR